MCVMDGTVGMYVAQRVKELIVPYFETSASWNEIIISFDGVRDFRTELLIRAVREVIKNSDEKFLAECYEKKKLTTLHAPSYSVF
jgi:hypothetical protein